MGKRRSSLDMRLEHAFDRLFTAKLQRVHEILVPAACGAKPQPRRRTAMKNAAIYARVSSAQQEEHTIGSQTVALIAFAQEPGYHVPREWIFESSAGFSPNYPADRDWSRRWLPTMSPTSGARIPSIYVL
jgi:hypothetical protein